MVLEIFISGLVAFVRGNCTVNSANTMQIVMVKATESKETHLPRLIVDMDDVDPSTSIDPDEILELSDAAGSQLAVWKLDNREITVVNAPAMQIYEGNREKSGDLYVKPKPDPKNPRTDFSWAPEMYRACGVAPSEAVPRLEVRTPRTFSYVDGSKTVQFAVARFATFVVDPTVEKPKPADNQLETQLKDANPKVFKFKTADYRQALADRARLTMTIPPNVDNLIEIQLLDLTDPKNKTPKSIFLKAGSKKVSISASNLPTMLHHTSPDPEEVTHFKEYVKLLKNSATLSCPNPVEDRTFRAVDETPVSAHPVKCTICVDCGP